MHSKCQVLISAFALTAMLSGCVSVRAHLEERARVDQELPAGAEELYPNRAKTRQVIVIEVEEKNKAEAAAKGPETGAEKKAPAGQSQVLPDAKQTVVVHDSNFTFPDQDPGALIRKGAAAPQEFEQYTVQKDDTLQKIAKKLYGSYSKWTMIYDANRDVIKDPNFLKPGNVLKIPVSADAAPAAKPDPVPEE